MPRLMEKKDWMRTVANVGSADRVWFDNVMGREGSLSFSIPESGMYQVILVKLDSKPEIVMPKRKSAHDLIGCGRRFNPTYRSTADIMHDLREGEDESPKTMSLFETLRNCPFGGVELNVERDHTAGRQVEFA